MEEDMGESLFGEEMTGQQKGEPENRVLQRCPAHDSLPLLWVFTIFVYLFGYFFLLCFGGVFCFILVSVCVSVSVCVHWFLFFSVFYNLLGLSLGLMEEANQSL